MEYAFEIESRLQDDSVVIGGDNKRSCTGRRRVRQRWHGGTLESITKPRLSTGSEFCIFNRFPRGNYLVWWVRVRVRVRVSLGVRVSVEVRIRVRVSNLLGSG